MRTSSKFLMALTLVSLVSVGCSRAPETAMERAQSEYKSGQWELAISSCDEHLAANPDDCKAISLRARSLAADGRYDEALLDMSRWVELAPADPEAFYHCAITYDKLGEDDLSEADNRRAKAIDPLHKQAYVFEIDSSQPNGIPVRQADAEDPKSKPAVAQDDTMDTRGEGNSSEDSGGSSVFSRGVADKEPATKSDRMKAKTDYSVLSDPKTSLGNNESPTATSAASDDASTKGAVERVAQQLYVPEETSPMTVPNEAENFPPTRPAISSALPTDPYGNVFVPGQQPLGSNPNAPYRPNSVGYPANFGGQFGAPNSNLAPQVPMSTSLPPQLQGRLGTNAGVSQYGGAHYPTPGLNPGVPTPGFSTRQATGNYNSPIVLPNNNTLAPNPTLQPPGAAGRAPVSSALPPDYLERLQQSRSTTVPTYGPASP